MWKKKVSKINKFFLAISLCYIFLAKPVLADIYSCPNHEFLTNLSQGRQSEDVRLLQKILNADRRTVVALYGAGSPGKETTIFGRATRESLKRFQALFIEYIGVADGKLNQRTRVSLTAVCKGPYFTGGGGGVYDLASSTTDILPPIVAIAAPRYFSIDTPFRAYIGATEAIQTPSLSGLIITGATVQDIRKISSTTYNFLVTPNPDVRDVISIQIEADAVRDLAGNKNINASNEWLISKSTSSTTNNIIPIDPLINLPTLFGSTTIISGKDCSQVASVSVSDYSNQCYGKVPMTSDPYTPGSSDSSSEKDSSSQITQMLTGLLQGLVKNIGGFGGNPFSGGAAAAPGTCVCTPNTVPPGMFPGQPTISLISFGGTAMPGRYLMTLNPGPGGKYLGEVVNFVGPVICGQAMVPIPHSPLLRCVNPLSDSTGMPLVGSIPTSPKFMWAR